MKQRTGMGRLTVLLAAVVAAGSAGQARAAEAYLRVVDVGNAMCVIAKVPGGHFMLFDAGNFDTDECAAAVQELVGTDKLDLVVLSHSDADHVAELPDILKHNKAQRIVYTGATGTAKKTWPKVLKALVDAETLDGTKIRNLSLEPLPNVPAPGKPQGAPLKIKLGKATATFVAGWHRWPFPGDSGAAPNPSELRNVISIVVRFEYGGKTVLLTGDTIGRRGRTSEPETACRDAERWMVQRGNVPLDSDVLVGQHHGADNSSSACFIEAVTPRFVIFPAGHADHAHPRAVAVQRFLSRGVPKANIFRTDRGDDDAGDVEWSEGLEPGCEDPSGDDDVEIFLSDQPGTQVRVKYRQPRVPCPK